MQSEDSGGRLQDNLRVLYSGILAYRERDKIGITATTRLK